MRLNKFSATNPTREGPPDGDFTTNVVAGPTILTMEMEPDDPLEGAIIERFRGRAVWCSEGSNGSLHLSTKLPDGTEAARLLPAFQPPSPSEAILGFAAWLTTREGTLTAGAGHNAAPMAKLVEEYRRACKYAPVGPDYPRNIPRVR
jgi:hypothetical protein